MSSLEQNSHIHLIGIGGSGLSAIARVLHQKGFKVSGSDREGSSLTRDLMEEGIIVYEGHRPENIKGATIVVRSSAIKDDNSEVQAAFSNGIPVLKRSEFLKYLLEDKKVIAVAGTHGKTTTTAMMAWILTILGADPSYIIGGISKNLGTNAKAGKGEYFVIEADEYDRMFLGIQPYLAIITNIEHDHPDCYPTEEEFIQAFVSFAKGVKTNGILVLYAQDKNIRRLIKEVKNLSCTIALYGGEEQARHTGEGYWVRAVEEQNHRRKSYQVNYQGSCLANICLQVYGMHNVLNATAVIAAAHQLGLPMKEVEQGLKEFQGSGRRLEVKGVFKGITFLDDYAHHPTEIKAAVKAAKEKIPQKNIWGIWQPHTYTRLLSYQREFFEALKELDRVLVMDVYAAREVPPREFDIRLIVDELQKIAAAKVVHTPQKEDVIKYLSNELTGDVTVIVLSAGNANEIIPQTLRRLKESDQEKRGKVAENKEHLQQEALRLFGEKIKFNVPLKHYTTIQVGGEADLFIEADSRHELIKGAAFAWVNNLPLTILGSGSNVLISDKGIRGVVILNRANKVEIIHENGSAWIWAESGANFSGLARSAAKQGLKGLEWAVGIPGTFGGAVVGNAGAHGSELSSMLIVAEILQQKAVKEVVLALPNNDQEIISSLSEYIPPERMEYRYRSSTFKENKEYGLILSARLKLHPGDKNEIQKKMEEYLTRRKQVQPAAPNMGSVFKNPPNGYAGRLIEECGLKGKKIGGAMVSQEHGNFFINTGGATATDFWELICYVQDAVQKQCQVTLALEIERLGEWN